MPQGPLDRVDLRILDLLQREGRLTNLEIAEKVNLSPSPVLRRVRRLEEEGVIKETTALPLARAG
jgi:Lrp/AsnC family leucine-responsive transcriptional regulator